MTGRVLYMTPGSVRYSYTGRHRVWGDIAEQVKEAQRLNAEQWSRRGHTTGQLYLMNDDCPHDRNPDDDPRYEGVDDLVDAEMARRFPGLPELQRDQFPTWDDYFTALEDRAKLRRMAEEATPQWVEYSKVLGEWEDVHDSGVCLDSPAGTHCLGCHPDEDDGCDSPDSGCELPELARGAWDDFWAEYGERDL